MRRRILTPLLGVAAAAIALAGADPAMASGQMPTAVIGCGDITALDAAIDAANAHTGPSTIVLAPDCAYDILTPAGSSVFGPAALPEITSAVTLTGVRTTIANATNSMPFRIAAVSGTAASLMVQGITASEGLAGGSGGCYGVTAGATLVLKNSAVTDCSALKGGGGIIVNLGATADIDDSVLTGNFSTAGGAIYTEDGGSANVTGSYLSENQANRGAAIYADGSGLMVTASTITGNQADDQGGGIYNEGSPMLVAGSTLQQNTAGDSGGGIANYGPSTLQNTVVVANGAPSGGGVWQGGGHLTPILTVIAGNTPNNCEPIGSVPGCTS
jgi:hypothetical protein